MSRRNLVRRIWIVRQVTNNWIGYYRPELYWELGLFALTRNQWPTIRTPADQPRTCSTASISCEQIDASVFNKNSENDFFFSKNIREKNTGESHGPVVRTPDRNKICPPLGERLSIRTHLAVSAVEYSVGTREKHSDAIGGVEYRIDLYFLSSFWYHVRLFLGIWTIIW